MIYGIFSENDWTYPDTDPAAGGREIALDAARGGSAGFQLLTDLDAGLPELSWEGPGRFSALRMLPAVVDENSGRECYTTTDYPSVSDFVTRRAPFEVYDRLAPLSAGAGRLALFVRIDIPAGAEPGEYSCALRVGAERIPAALRVYPCEVPPAGRGRFHMINWLASSGMSPDELDAYLDSELEMRNDIFTVPRGLPIRDGSGRVTGFDFSAMENMAETVLKKGFSGIVGGCVAHWKVWDEPGLLLSWDANTDPVSDEGFRQLGLYFTALRRLIAEKGWTELYMQSLCDEPQDVSAANYRALACICRRFMPGVRINEPLETPDLAGAVDVWTVKQAVWQKHRGRFEALRAAGEELWIYTCGFPAGKMMNRVMDLPLTASRLTLWMSVAAGATGFLHWGYNYHNPERERATCYRPNEREKYPAGNSFVVYPGQGGPELSVRWQSQMMGAQDAELLLQLAERDPEAASALIARVCRSFSDYETSGAALDSAKRSLLELLSK